MFNKFTLEEKILIIPNYLQVYCVVSKLGSLELYNVLLDKLAELHAVSEAAVHGFLSATVNISFSSSIEFIVSWTMVSVV